MKGSSLNVEKILQKGAMDIDIDENFKNDLKKRIMASAAADKENAVIELPKRSRVPYRKVAGWVIAAALSGSTILGAGSLYSRIAAGNHVDKSVAEVNKNSQGSEAGTSNKNIGNENTEASGQIVASADNKGNPPAAKESTPAAKPQSPKAGTKATAPQSTPKPQPQNPAAAAPAETAPAAGSQDSKAVESTPTEPVSTFSFTIESGRYLIKNISVVNTENVPALPEEYKSLTPEEWAKQTPGTGDGTVYEKNGSVYMISHVNKKEIFIDKGKTPVLYAPIGIVSYIKDETIKDGDNEKSTSSVWIFDGNSTNKYNILSSDSSKYSYLNTFWSSDGKTIYVLSLNNETNKYELTKVTLNIEQ